MKDFNGIKLNYDNFTAFNLKFLHDKTEIYFDVNQDMPDDILPVVQFNEATDKAISSLEQDQNLQCLNDKFALEWAYTVPNESINNNNLKTDSETKGVEYNIDVRPKLRRNSIS